MITRDVADRLMQIAAEIREYLTAVGPGEYVDEDVVAGFADDIERMASSDVVEARDATAEERAELDEKMRGMDDRISRLESGAFGRG